LPPIIPCQARDAGQLATNADHAQGVVPGRCPDRPTFYFTSIGAGGPEASIPHNACNRQSSLEAVLGQPLEIFLDGLAEVGGQLAANLL
jgi:hypothetical protein